MPPDTDPDETLPDDLIEKAKDEAAKPPSTKDDASDPAPTQEPEPPFPEQGLERPGKEADMDPRPRYEAPAYEPTNKLEGRRALITGGDSGIGRAVAVLYAREGAHVAFTHLPEEHEDARETLETIQDEGVKALAIEADLTDENAPEEAVERTVQGLGGLDLLVNNAAFQEHVDDVRDVSWEQWKHTFDVNIHGYFRVTKAALDHLEPGSSVINTGSILGLEGRGTAIDYATTKGAINTFTKSLAEGLIEEGIRVNCVAPGPVWTPLNPAERSYEDIEEFGGSTGLNRPAQPEEIAPSYVFFASNADSSAITGEVLTVLAGDTRAG